MLGSDDEQRARRRVRRLASFSAAAALAATGLLAATIMPASSASSADGYATANGGTTGGEGGQVVRASTGTQIHEAICGRSSNDEPIIVEVEGTINHGNTSKVSGSCNTAADRIELKDISNVSIIGVGNGALFDELGIHIRNSSNIIVQNVHVRNVKKSGSPTSNGGDAIGMESNVSNVWVDHVTLEAQGGESSGYDALFDLKANTQYVTLSYSILKNSGRGGLVGSSDSDDQNNYITYHHNLYQNIDSRTPLLRHATAHSYNNYFDGINKSGMNPRIGGRIKAEHNYFKDAKDPIGTFYTSDMGYWEVKGNIYDNVTWSSASSDYNPAGPNPQSTTSFSVPYSYNLDDASCVPDIVSSTAGANKGLATSDGSCGTDPGSTTSTTTGDTNPTTPPPSDGTNLSIGAGGDGSSKASGSSYGNVRDGDLGTSWSPSGSTGRISIKWGQATTVGEVRIIERDGSSGNITIVVVDEFPVANVAGCSFVFANHDRGDGLSATPLDRDATGAARWRPVGTHVAISHIPVTRPARLARAVGTCANAQVRSGLRICGQWRNDRHQQRHRRQ